MKLSIILLQKGWFVQVRFEMLAHMENTKMIRILPKDSMCFWGVSIVKGATLLVLMNTMWQVHLI
jgi:hypothetical protein